MKNIQTFEKYTTKIDSSKLYKNRIGININDDFSGMSTYMEPEGVPDEHIEPILKLIYDSIKEKNLLGFNFELDHHYTDSNHYDIISVTNVTRRRLESLVDILNDIDLKYDNISIYFYSES